MSRLRLVLIFVCTLVASLAPCAGVAVAAPGQLDPSFGSGGLVKLLESKEKSYVEGLAVQPDGKVVIGGIEEAGTAVVIRLLPNGQPDPAFGGGDGKVTTAINGGSGIRAVAVQPDGKIVVAGAAKGALNDDSFFARYNADGSPDGSFGGGDGVEIVQVGAESDEMEAVAVAPDGKIVGSGTLEVPPNDEDLAVVVLTPAGVPDPAFGGGDGTVTKSTSAGDDRGVAVEALAAGRILVGDNNGAGGGDGFFLLKLGPDGEYDPGFGGGDGIVETPIPGEGFEPGDGSGRVQDIALLPDGRIVAAGYGFDYTGAPPTYLSKLAVARYLPGGELDPSFASGGIFSRRIDREGQLAAVALDQKGRALLAGEYTIPANETQAAVVGRLDANGNLDPTFGSGGLTLRTDTAPFGEYPSTGAVDAQGRLLTVGMGYGGDNTSWGTVTRYQGDPIPTPPTRVNQLPHASMKAVPKKVRVGKLKGFSGSAADPDGDGVAQVQVALVRKVAAKPRRRGKRAGRLGFRCFALKSARPSFQRTKLAGKQCPQLWLSGKGTAKWSFKFKGKLPPGRYVVFARAIDGAGLAESAFSHKLGNRYAFRVLPPKRKARR